METLIRQCRALEEAADAAAANGDAARSRAILGRLRVVKRVARLRRRVGKRRCGEALVTRPSVVVLKTKRGRTATTSRRHAAQSAFRTAESWVLAAGEAASALADFGPMEEELTAVAVEYEHEDILRRMKVLITTAKYHEISGRMNQLSLFSPPPPPPPPPA